MVTHNGVKDPMSSEDLHSIAKDYLEGKNTLLYCNACMYTYNRLCFQYRTRLLIDFALSIGLLDSTFNTTLFLYHTRFWPCCCRRRGEVPAPPPDDVLGLRVRMDHLALKRQGRPRSVIYIKTPLLA